MVAAGSDEDLIRRDAVDEPMLVCDAARPVPLELVPQRLGLSSPGKRVSRRLPNELYEFLVDLWVERSPVGKLCKGSAFERDRSHWKML